MAIKKSELYSSIWQSCDEMRGGMDASQYKDYVLVLLFVKYVSDRYADQPDAPIEVPTGGRFADMIAAKNQKDIGDQINKIIAKLAKANGLEGVIDVADFNDDEKLGKGKDMQDRLSNLVGIFQNAALNFSKNRADGDDILGDAYEYLMRHFATESGKSKGQFYTPGEVSRVMAKIIGIGSATRAEQTLYDPTCGSGSLLLKAADEARVKVTLYGQEMDNATRALAQMNMILHDHPSAEIWRDNTLSSPHFLDADGRLKRFDYIVANPPFSSKAWSNGFDPAHDQFKRFADGIPPTKNGDYAFLLHILASLKSNGTGAVILPHGVLFRGNAESDIRARLIKKGYIKAIIGLPANLFYGTGIPACIIVLDKKEAGGRKGIFMIDASRGFIKDGNKNRLRHQDIHKIVDVFTKQLELAKYSRFVPNAEISDAKNAYNLNIPRYIDASEPEDVQDIEAHLRGGVPNLDVDNLSAYWQVFPTLKAELFAPHARAGYSELRLEGSRVKAAMLNHEEFSAYTQTVTQTFETWRAQHAPTLEGITTTTHPKALIETLSEDLLLSFKRTALMDAYDVYQHLMTYWSEILQDDAYLIVEGGWEAAAQLRTITDGADGKKSREDSDFKLGGLKLKADLIPPALIVARYFAADQAHVETLELTRDALTRQLEELEEEHASDDGLLSDARDDKDKLTKQSLKARLGKAMLEPDSGDERDALEMYLSLIDNEAEAGRRVKEAQKALDTKVIARYRTLTEAEVKTLVVHDKWLAALSAAVQSELNRVSMALTGRVKTLADRYDATLPQLEEDVTHMNQRVAAHLQRMGYAWQ